MKKMLCKTWPKALAISLILVCSLVFAMGLRLSISNYRAGIYNRETWPEVKELLVTNEYENNISSVSNDIFNGLFGTAGKPEALEKNYNAEKCDFYFEIYAGEKKICGTYSGQKGLDKHSKSFREYTAEDDVTELRTNYGSSYYADEYRDLYGDAYGLYYYDEYGDKVYVAGYDEYSVEDKIRTEPSETVLTEFTVDIYPKPEMLTSFASNVETQPMILGMSYLSCFNYRYLFIAAMIAPLAIAMILMIFLTAAAGHKTEDGSITLNAFDRIPFDIVFFVAAIAEFFMFSSFMNSYGRGIIYMAVTAFIMTACLIPLILTFAARVKKGSWWKNTVIYRVPYFLIKNCMSGMKKSSFAFKLALGAIGFLFLQFIIICIAGSAFSTALSAAVISAAELFTLIPCAVIAAAWMKQLKDAAWEISTGKYDYKIDTKNMKFGFKEFGGYLNNIGAGMNDAVEERLKSERLKTELITNVSHDIKTPLTSIINYADLISREETDNEKIKEYSEVLLRQSDKLKRLVTDLVEASKITSGNIESKPSPIDLKLMCEQLEGEYSDRLSEKNLSLVTQLGEVPMMISADGRHLQRIFDNLFNNVLKYAMPGTRVYLELKENEGKAELSMKNISGYQLGISASELMERFVRGDSSRHSEGNGLGLSIAEDLAKAMGGKLELQIDGDLFKATVSFPKLAPTETIAG